jgi:hypothetical protein
MRMCFGYNYSRTLLSALVHKESGCYQFFSGQIVLCGCENLNESCPLTYKVKLLEILCQ